MNRVLLVYAQQAAKQRQVLHRSSTNPAITRYRLPTLRDLKCTPSVSPAPNPLKVSPVSTANT
jgi:hypothetical protein